MLDGTVVNIFGRLLNRTIYINRDILSDSYRPIALPGRESQIKELSGKLSGPDMRVLALGTPGTGKTAVVEHVGRNLVEAGFKYVYINCGLRSTENAVLSYMYHQFKPRAKGCGKWTKRIYEELNDVLARYKGKGIILVLDEFDKFRASEGYVHDIIKNSKLRTVAISNVSTLKLSSGLVDLFDEEVDFGGYSIFELEQILEGRREAFKEGSLLIEKGLYGRSAMSYVVYYSATHDKNIFQGDARKAIGLIRRSGDLAEKDRAERISRRHIREAFALAFPQQRIATLSPDELKALSAILKGGRYISDVAQNAKIDTTVATDAVRCLDMKGLVRIQRDNRGSVVVSTLYNPNDGVSEMLAKNNVKEDHMRKL